MIRVDLGAIQFNTDVADANGTKWWLDGFDGWDGPPLRQDVAAPTGRHGGVLSESMLGARPLVLHGIAKVTGTETNFWAAYNTLLGQVNNLSTNILLKVYEKPTTKQIDVIRGGQPRIAMKPGHFIFEIPMLALNPLKYAATETSTAVATADVTLTLNNPGNFDTYLTFTVTGTGGISLQNQSIPGSPQWANIWAPATDLPSGTVVNFLDRTVTQGSTDHYGKVHPASIWFPLIPGNNTIFKRGDNTLTIYHRGAWI